MGCERDGSRPIVYRGDALLAGCDDEVKVLAHSLPGTRKEPVWSSGCLGAHILHLQPWSVGIDRAWPVRVRERAAPDAVIGLRARVRWFHDRVTTGPILRAERQRGRPS